MKTLKEIETSSLSLNELKLIAEARRIKNSEDLSKGELFRASKKSERFKDIKEIRKENRDENKIIRDLRALYEPEEDYYKPQKIKSVFDDNYFEYESNGDKNKTLSIGEYLSMIRPYLTNITDEHKDGWKIQLTMEVTSVPVIKDSDKDSNEDSDKNFNEP